MPGRVMGTGEGNQWLSSKARAVGLPSDRPIRSGIFARQVSAGSEFPFFLAGGFAFQQFKQGFHLGHDPP